MSMTNSEFQDFFNELSDAARNHGDRINEQDSSVGTDQHVSTPSNVSPNMSGITSGNSSSGLDVHGSMQGSSNNCFSNNTVSLDCFLQNELSDNPSHASKPLNHDFITVSSPPQVSAMQSIFPSTTSVASHGATDMLLASASTQRSRIVDNVGGMTNAQSISLNGQQTDNVMAAQTVDMMDSGARNECSQANNQMNSQQIVLDNSNGNTNAQTLMPTDHSGVSSHTLNMQNVNSQHITRNQVELNSQSVMLGGNQNIQNVAKGILNAQTLMSGNIISIPLQQSGGVGNQISINSCGSVSFNDNQCMGMMDQTQMKAPVFVNQNINVAQTVTGQSHVDSQNASLNTNTSVGSHESPALNVSRAVDMNLPNVFVVTQGNCNSPKMLIVNPGKDSLSGQTQCSFGSQGQLNIKDLLSLDSQSQVNVSEPAVSLTNEQNSFLHKLLMEARGSLNIVTSRENSSTGIPASREASVPTQRMDLGSRDNINLVGMLNNQGILNVGSVNTHPKPTNNCDGAGCQAQQMELGSQGNINLTTLLSNHGSLNSDSMKTNAQVKAPVQEGTHLHHMDLGNHENMNLTSLLTNNSSTLSSTSVQQSLQAENSSRSENVAQNIGGNVGQNISMSVSQNIGGNVGQNIGMSVSQNIGGNVGQNIGMSVNQNIGGNVGQTIGGNVGQNIGGNVGQNIGGNVGQNIGGNVGQNIGGNVGQNLGGNVGQNIGTQCLSLGNQDSIHLTNLLSNKGNMNSEQIQIVTQSARSPEQIHIVTQSVRSPEQIHSGTQEEAVKSPVMMSTSSASMTHEGNGHLNGQGGQKIVGELNMESTNSPSHVIITDHSVSENMDICPQGNISVHMNQTVQSVTGQTIGGQNMIGQNLSGQSVAGQSIGSQNMVGQNINAQGINAQSMSGQSVGGQCQNANGQTIVNQNMSGQNLVGPNVGGQNTDVQQMETRMEVPMQENYSGDDAGRKTSQTITNSVNRGGVNTTLGLPLDLHNICLDTFQSVPLNVNNMERQQSTFPASSSQSLSVQLESPVTVATNQHQFSTTSVFSTTANNFHSVSISETTENTMTHLNTLAAAAENQLQEQAVNAKLSQPCTLNVTPQGSMLRRMLTGDCDDASLSPSSPVSNPENQLESPGALSSPNNFFQDMTTQSTLINNAEKLHLNSDAFVKDETNDGFNLLMTPFQTDDDANVPNKIHKGRRDDDAHSSRTEPICVDKLFDANGASSTTSYEFTKFGSDIPSVFKFGLSSKASTVSTSCTSTRAVPSLLMSMSQGGESLKSVVPPPAKPAAHNKKFKEPSLSGQFPNRSHGYELQIISQPEEQHRARYLTEGSRGAVKDRSQQSYPIVKLHGYNESVKLHVFVGCETGRMKPHGFYQACKVAGKNSTPCIEKEIDGTVVIELDINPNSDMTASVDCVGILKLRNADVEKRIGVAKARAKKKNSTRARLVFRTTFQRPDGHYITLQASSTPILCTQPIGQPEILRVSLTEATVSGGQSLFIIGKNFLKNTQVFFQEVVIENGTILWEKEADIEQEFFQQTHLICTVPDYHNTNIEKPVDMQIVVKCRGKTSDPHEFLYRPLPTAIKVEDPMETDQIQSKSVPYGVSPVAMDLIRQVEQHQTVSTTSLFQLPPGTVQGITSTVATSVPMSAPPVQSNTPSSTFQLPTTPMSVCTTSPSSSSQMMPAVHSQSEMNCTESPTTTSLKSVFMNSSPTSGNLQTSSPLVSSTNMTTTPQHVAPAVTTTQAPLQTPMILILPGTTNSNAIIQPMQDMNNVEALLKSLLGGHQNGLR